MSFTLFITGKPIAIGRPRVTRYSVYTPGQDYKQFVADYIRLHWAGEPIEYAAVTIVIVRARTKALLRPKAPRSAVWCNTKPDGDNVEKGILDAIKGAGVVSDDGRVVSCVWYKCYHAAGGEPGVWIQIEDAGAVPAFIQDALRSLGTSGTSL